VTEPLWISTQATVTTCRFQSPALTTLIIGVNTNERFRITFDYYAHGRLYSDEFQSPVAIPQNETFAITYNPLNPQQNSRTWHSVPSRGGGPPLFLIGIAGSVVLSLIWLAMLRSCS
jgi:hypothetical protein